MKQITEIELKKILESHTKWLKGKDGVCADLSFTNLRGADLGGANLRGAYLRGADLGGANLRGANLFCADLYNANLCSADLGDAILQKAILFNANLHNADLRGADLCGAYLNGADLSGANMYDHEKVRNGIILKERMFGYKKTLENKIIKIRIPKGAIVFSINHYKCRTNKAKVVKCEGVQHSIYDHNFEYVKGKIMEVDDFDLMYNIECSNGIHFFRTMEEAENYKNFKKLMI